VRTGKAATLVSRASEKDLYALSWLFAHARHLDVPTLKGPIRGVERHLRNQPAPPIAALIRALK
jgi:hypothetical protein